MKFILQSLIFNIAFMHFYDHVYGLFIDTSKNVLNIM